MIVERLVIEDAGSSRYLELHPRLTVVPGLDEADRRVLLAEIRGSLGAHRDGVHIEITTSSGTSLAAFRAADGHRMINVDNGTDVTPGFVDPAGRLNPAYGLALQEEDVLVDASTLANRTDEDRKLDLLSGSDQEELWGVLDRIDETQGAISEAESEHAILAAPKGDSEVSAEVYDNYFTSSVQVPMINKIASIAAVIGLGCAVALYFFLASVTSIVALGLGIVSLIALGFFGYPLIRQLRAQRAANSALEDAGVDNFFNFQLQQVDGMIAQDGVRKKLREASSNHQTALEEWNQLANGIDPEFALAHRSAIQLGATIRANDPNDDPTSGFLHPTTPLLLRCVGAIDNETEISPRVLDAPFATLDDATRRALLDTMFEASAQRQVILLAGCDDAAAWALQHIGGEASISPGFQTAEDPVPAS